MLAVQAASGAIPLCTKAVRVILCSRSVSSASAVDLRGGYQRAVVIEDDQLQHVLAAAIPRPVWDCLHRLRAAGHETYLVGGAVRDLLLRCGAPKDWDVLTSATLHQAANLFERPALIGRRFPICALQLHNGTRVELSSMHVPPPCGYRSGSWPAVPQDAARRLSGTSHTHTPLQFAHMQPGGHRRRPSALPNFSGSPAVATWAAMRRENALSRDFTVNALLYDPFSGLLFDYVGGAADAAARQLRAVGEPGAKFQEDPARLLRAVRCASRAGLNIEPRTAAALQQHACLATRTHPQRLGSELLGMLAFGAAAPALTLLARHGLMAHLLPLQHAQLQHLARLQGKQQHACSDNHAVAAQLLPQAGAAAAGSALGRLLLSLDKQQAVLQPLSEQQQQQQQGAVEPWHNSLLMRVAIELDKLSSLKQPAPAAVVLACLTAPLVVELMQAAIAHARVVLDQSEQQQQQQQQQSHQQQLIWPLHLANTWGHGMPVVLAAPTAAAVTAGTALGSSSSSAGNHQAQRPSPTLPSNTAAKHSRPRAFCSNAGSATTVEAAAAAEDAAQQLLQGTCFAEVVRQQALALAQQVSRLQSTDSSSDVLLFGASAPSAAAQLLASHVLATRSERTAPPTRCMPSPQQGSQELQQQQLQQQQQSQQQQQQQRRRRGPSAIPPWHSLPAATESPRHETTVPPRSNRQWRQFMERQRAAASFDVGAVSSVAVSEELLLAATLVEECATWQEPLHDASVPAVAQHSNAPSPSHAHVQNDMQLVHAVLMASRIGLGELDIAAAALPASCM